MSGKQPPIDRRFNVLSERERAWPPTMSSEGDLSLLERELAEAHKTIRALLRQNSKEQSRYTEIARAYDMTVANLVKITRENAELAYERNMWKARAEGATARFQVGFGALELTSEEVSAIRKAMARLHHPDAGGDSERMKMWNAALDPLEE